jgi:hypothetical protein
VYGQSVRLPLGRGFFPAMESLVTDIPAGDRKTDNLSLQCMVSSATPAIPALSTSPTLLRTPSSFSFLTNSPSLPHSHSIHHTHSLAYTPSDPTLLYFLTILLFPHSLSFNTPSLTYTPSLAYTPSFSTLLYFLTLPLFPHSFSSNTPLLPHTPSLPTLLLFQHSFTSSHFSSDTPVRHNPGPE